MYLINMSSKHIFVIKQMDFHRWSSISKLIDDTDDTSDDGNILFVFISESNIGWLSDYF